MTVEQFLHDPAHLLRIDMAIEMDHPTLAGVLVKDGQHFEIPTADRLIVDKVPGPNMAGMFGLCRQPGGDTPAPASWLAWGDRQDPVHVADLARDVYPPASLRPSTAS